LLVANAVAHIAVVLGYHAEQVRQELLSQPVAQWLASNKAPRVVHALNPHPEAGTASSLHCGLRALPADLDTWLVVLGDQPLLEASDIHAILQAWPARQAGVELVVPQHGEAVGHPVAFGQTLRDLVLQTPGLGIRQWRHQHPERLQLLPVDHPRCTTDVDTPEDIERLRQNHGVQLELPRAETSLNQPAS
ncbi:MAG: nucleotidyltransferase family protein, partial [Sinobacteraceae bacterium]|nr:nucleotidyltransferase family protein [Nevskiaceae bacterium]